VNQTPAENERPTPPAGHRRWPRRLARVALGLAGLFLFLVLVVAPWWLVSRLVRGRFVYPDRENAGLTPASFQLAFDDVSFTASDGVSLQGWWVPAAPARGSVVLVHGLNRSRIEMIRKVPFLHARGWNALLYDSRHHGRSGGDRSSFGWFERHDVRAAVAEAGRRSPGPVVVWGISMGAAGTILAAAEDPAIAGVVADSSYRNLEDTVRHHLGAVGRMRPWLRVVPTGLLAAESLFWIRRIAGFDTGDADIVKAAGRLGGRPALFVANAGDWRMPSEIAFELKAAAGDRARVLVAPGKKHAGAFKEATAAYESAVAEVLDDVLL
jgi:hypothetical protein